MRFEDVPLLHINTTVTIIRTEPPKNCQRPPLDYTTANETPLQLEEIQVPNTASPRIMLCGGKDQQPKKTPVFCSRRQLYRQLSPIPDMLYANCETDN